MNKARVEVVLSGNSAKCTEWEVFHGE